MEVRFFTLAGCETSLEIVKHHLCEKNTFSMLNVHIAMPSLPDIFRQVSLEEITSLLKAFVGRYLWRKPHQISC